MHDDEAVRDLMGKLMRAVEASISASAAVREALAELVRNGYEARLFFVANAESAGQEGEDGKDVEDADGASDEPEARFEPEIGAVPDGGDLRFELTKLDRDFLKSLHIRPDSDPARD